MPNRLIHSNSPYLLQHAENPVDWYPWGEEALQRARQEDKPIFLSIGYAACHWCHVMAHESFEDAGIAALMNEHFVNVKVDREERPDLDSLYMNAVVAMTGQGGWPMSIFLTPEGKPFFGGTYFPPARRFGMPSFREILVSLARAWREDRENLLNVAGQLDRHLQEVYAFAPSPSALSPEALERASLALAQTYDWKHGGWGNAPKFPQPMAIDFLLRRASRGDSFALEMAVHALRAMARGGMYDVIGGGFARYSTDERWLIPHFEKMLTDNALLAACYLHAYLLTGEPGFRQVCEDTLDFVARELTDPSGGFYSSLDADSEGEEGAYYLLTPEEIRRALGDPAQAELFEAAYGVTGRGNFNGRNALQRALSDAELAEQFGFAEETVAERLRAARAPLLQARQGKARPAVDDKALVAWNGLAMAAFAEAGRYLRNSRYVEMAMRNARFLLEALRPSNRLLRSYRRGRASLNAFLDDHAALILGLLALYQADPQPAWYSAASRLAEEMIDLFHDPRGGFFDTPHDHEDLLARPKDLQDNALPSGNALAVFALLQLSAFSEREDWRQLAESMLAAMLETGARHPLAFSYWLCAADFALQPALQVAILGQTDNPLTQGLLDPLLATFRPSLVLASSPYPPPPDAPALLADRPLLNDRPTAYLCRNFTCRLPVNSPEELRAQLEEIS